MAATLAPPRLRRRRPGGGSCRTQICVRDRRRGGDEAPLPRAYGRRVRTSARFDRRDLVPALPVRAVGVAPTSRARQNQAGWLAGPDAEAYPYVAVAALALLLRRRAPR